MMSFFVGLAHGLRALPLRYLDIQGLEFPVQARLNISAGLLYCVGMLMYSLTSMFNLNLSQADNYRVGTIQTFYALYWSIFWSLSSLIACILLESFNTACRSGKDVLFCITFYRRLSDCLSCYLFIFISLTQFLSVAYSFLSFSKFLTKSQQASSSDYLVLAGQILLLLGYLLNLIGTVCAVDSTFSSVQKLREILEDKLEMETERGERRTVKLLLGKVRSLGPITACGYFDISKNTLIGMLSVR